MEFSKHYAIKPLGRYRLKYSEAYKLVRVEWTFCQEKIQSWVYASVKSEASAQKYRGALGNTLGVL